MSNTWYVYLIRLANGHLYTGITTDPRRRLKEHCGDRSKGAKSLKGKGPLTLVWQQPVADKSMALRIEYQIKRLAKADKERIVAQHLAAADIVRG